MYGFEWNNQRGVEGTGFVRALRSLLTSHLPHFREDLDRILRSSLGDELKNVKADGECFVGILVFRIISD